MPSSLRKRDRLLFQFKADTVTTVSRESLSEVAKTLGFNETQTVHLAVARLRDQVLRGGTSAAAGDEEPYPPLTADQLIDIRSHEPKSRGKLVRKQSLF